MKRKQNVPRRIRPVEITDELNKEPLVENDSVHASDEPEAKRIKSDPETATESTCDATDSSEWKWNIADFRKEHSKEQLDYSKERSNNSKEHSNQLEQLPNDSKEASKEASNSSKESNGNIEHSKERVNNCMESFESSKESGNKTEEFENNSKEIGGNLKKSLLRNPPQVSRNQNQVVQGWKIPVRSLKEPLSHVKLQPPPSELNSNTSFPERNVSNFRNEIQNDNMPVILNVFSLSKDPAQQFISNTKQENSVLFTPPCSPPFIQLGAFSALPISSQHLRFRNDFMNQAAFQQGRENWYKPVQQAHQNFQEYLNKPVQQAYYNYQEYLSKPVQQVTSQEYLNKPVQQAYYTPQEYQSKPVQQGYSQEFLNKPVQQVYNPQAILPKPVQPGNSQEYLNRPVQQVYNPQAILPKPVQPVNSHEYQNRPVQQVYTPQDYFSKSVQLVNSQQYSNYSVQQGNAKPYEYLSNPVQKVNPQEYVYSPVQYNPQQIANGVLPLEKQTSNQSLCETQAQPNTAQFSNQRYYNYVDNNNEPMSQLKSILTDNYLVERGNSMAKGNGLYARFKLKQPIAESNKASHKANNVSSQFSETPSTQDGSNVVCSGFQQTAQNQASGTAGMLSNTPSTVYTQKGMNALSNYSNGSVDKYRTEKGCSAILDGFGKNIVLQEGPTNNNNTYNVKLSENSFSSPTMISEKQSIYSENSLNSTTIYIPVSNGVSGEPGKGEFLSAHDAKVIQLKQRLEEQEATLKKLRANH